MKTNTKKSVLKLATAVVVFLFAVNSVNAQILINYQNVDETVYQTVGKDFRLYVLPDLVYSPDYEAATNDNLGATARWGWEWTYSEGDDGSTAPVNENWVEINDPAIGSYVFTVVESNTVVGCADAGTTRNVEVIAAPTATILTDDITDQCGDLAAQDIIVRISENVPELLAAYSFRITRLVQTIDVSDVEIDEITSDNLVNFPLVGKVTPAADEFVWAADGNHTYTIASDALDIVNGERTRYTYTLETVEAGVVGDGIVSAISQKSDFLAGQVNASDFGVGAKTELVFVVNPQPVTGPIYHIPNSFGL